MNAQSMAAILLYMAVILHLVGMSGWVVPKLSQSIELATLAFMLTALIALRKKKRKTKRRPRKPPAEVEVMLDQAQEGEAGK
ncbi:hypothetical protein BRE01_04860 [Brevibacillus reuszeri]|uniref:Uncharacterized protein n=1 Tax=Brevibacillus reuszeri TaxID=54915 RepID=A0A0K9YQM6_9BACL|nr:hypothetical protein [Brevibacillus reuszeri]KNB70976.1 hypothetical protein ADS79_19290 [Brevibacillus reuszeri]MED1857386.1 hypothetical protein [Brevibacillus reuszeri]GED66784.1 hypothetical protein BRE01_04860 [Brevibacillus reuszeri]